MTTEPTRRMFASLALLTFVTGIIDAASVLGLGHVFTANMTGNVVLLGFRLAGHGNVSLLASACALGGFLVGAALGGRLTKEPGKFRMVLGLEVAILLCAMVVEVGVGHEGAAREGLITLLGMAMGLQNAAVRRLGVLDMTTTVLTLTLTGLAADSRLAGGDGPRIGRRVASVLLMLSGAVSGAWLLSRDPRLPVMATVVVVTLAWLSAESGAPASPPKAPVEVALRARERTRGSA